MVNKNKVFVSAAKYFEKLKNAKHVTDITELDKMYNNCYTLFKKYQSTKQVNAMNKLLFHMQSLEKEKKLVDLGVDTFVYLKDIQNYIENIADKAVKIIELERYEREIPDEVVTAYEKVKDIFTGFFVVFTDYTHDLVEETKKEKDPILFGMFKDKEEKTVCQRMYYIGDWIDEYCDLTLDKMVQEMSTKEDAPEDITRKVTKPTESIEDLRDQLNNLQPVSSNEGNNLYLVPHTKETKKSFFKKVTNFLKI